MRTLVIIDDDVPTHRQSDVRDMVEALAKVGFNITQKDMYKAWDAYSDSMCAGWMVPPDDGWEVFYAIQSQTMEV